MKTYLLIAAAAIIQPAASLAQTAPAGAGFQQVDTVLGSGGGVITLQAGGRGGRGGQLMIGKPYSAATEGISLIRRTRRLGLKFMASLATSGSRMMALQSEPYSPLSKMPFPSRITSE